MLFMEYTYKIHQDTPDRQNEELARYEHEVFGTTDYSEQYTDTLPKTISRYMEDAKIGTNKLSRLTGIPKATITRYCNGTARYKEDYLCAICIALRLKPVKQRYLLGRLRHHLRDGIVEHTVRSYIIREYLDGCYYDDNLTVTSCNDRLRANEKVTMAALAEVHSMSVIKKNGLKMLRFHDLRHSCASLLLANDIPMKAIQEWLGHATFNITANLYSHLEYHAKVTSAETIARVLSGKKEDAPTDTKDTAPEEAPKKSNSRKKKKDTSADKSQPAAV